VAYFTELPWKLRKLHSLGTKPLTLLNNHLFNMSKIILSINAGSSSVKISVYSASQGQDPKELAETQIDGLTAPPPQLKYTRHGQSIAKNKKLEEKITSQKDAFKYMLDELIHDENLKAITKKEDIAIVCHRVVHGGEYDAPKIINEETYHHLEALTDLAPLHNASALEIVKLCFKELSGTKNVAVFDSQFHQTIPEHIYTYPINQEIAKKNKLRKYGFHGISYSFITRSVAKFLGQEGNETSLIMLHLGSGASVCAVKGGKSWDTSMGLTPLAGLPGATRSGSVDPRLVFMLVGRQGKFGSQVRIVWCFTTLQTLENFLPHQPSPSISRAPKRYSIKRVDGSL
jgi:acetate kinase